VRAATHVFARDLIDEGFPTVLDRLRDAGLSGVVLAGVYHHARDIFPHDPLRKVGFHDGGRTYFRPDPARYAGLAIQPEASSVTREVDPLGRLMEEADRRAMSVRVWTNNLHNSTMGERYPACTCRNVFGDAYPNALCPANPEVRAYVAALSADIARYGVSTLIPESVYYQPFEHGGHHERSHYTHSPAARFLLSLCFCDHCRIRAADAGVNVEGLSAILATELAKTIAGDPSVIDDLELKPGPVGDLFGGEMQGFLEVRRQVVSGLVSQIVEAVRSVGSTRVCVMDWSGGLASYVSGQAGGTLSLNRGWQDGIDAAELARIGDGLSVLAYTRDLGRFEADVHGYRELVPGDRSLSVALRPMPPDCVSPDELEAKVVRVRDMSIDWIEFYHYGLMRLSNLDWVAQALATVPQATKSTEAGLTQPDDEEFQRA